MSPGGTMKRRFREVTEHHLRIAAMERMRKTYPEVGARKPNYPGGAFWRWVFVPVYRRLPWNLKTTVMRRSGMIASGWTPPARRPGTPWTPPAPPPPSDD